MAESTLVATLLQFGAIGIVLAWMLLRQDRRVDALEKSVNKFSRVILLLLVSKVETDTRVKRQANRLLSELGHEEEEDEP